MDKCIYADGSEFFTLDGSNCVAELPDGTELVAVEHLADGGTLAVDVEGEAIFPWWLLILIVVALAPKNRR